MRSGVALWKALLVLGVVLVVVSDGGHVFGQGGRWTVRAPIPTPRDGLAVGVVNGIILYAVGGAITHRGERGFPVSTEYLSTVQAYNPSTNSWSSRAPLPTPRSGVGVGVVDGILYAVGGTSSETGRTEWNEYPLTLNTVDAYDPVTNSWEAKAPIPTRRYGYAVGVAKGTLYVVGGETSIETGLMEAYDPVTNRWTVRAPMPSVRKSLGVGVVNDILYAVGGICCGCCELEGKILRTVEAYDPITNTWTAKAPLPAPRAGASVVVANQALYVVGGFKGGGADGSGIALNVVEAYEPSRNIWTTKTSLPVDWFPAGLGAVKGILYAVGGWKRVQIAPEIARDTPGCGYRPCYELVQDPVTYALKIAP